MATSESDPDFESADEELGRSAPIKREIQRNYWSPPTTVDSESDDDTEYVQHAPYRGSDWQRRPQTYQINAPLITATGRKLSTGDKTKDVANVKVETAICAAVSQRAEKKISDKENKENECSRVKSEKSVISAASTKDKDTKSAVLKSESTESNNALLKEEEKRIGCRVLTQYVPRRVTTRRFAIDDNTADVDGPDISDTSDITMEQKDKSSVESSSKTSASADTECKSQEKFKAQSTDDQSESNDLSEIDMPEELKSNKKFKEIFEPDGWEGLGEDIELLDELTEEKLQPVMERLSMAGKESESSLGMWRNSWENWGVTSLINTATASVSTLTSHVSQGLTLLEGTIGGMQDSIEPPETNQDRSDDAEPKVQEQESQSYSSFGFGNLFSGVSSITKLVESTGSKVMTGGLDTLEAIGKKTMEVLQDGDPGLKKKRAFFMNDPDKPILSQILREAKEKAESEEKTLEERELARKIHFESLFDDYQGLVHLEALEMLSKQSNIKIQQHLIELSTDDLTSVQETLEEIKELCDLDGNEDDEDDEGKSGGDLKNRLKNACHDIGVNITYEKINDVWTETESYLASSSTHTDQEIFQSAISTLAQFTAVSVETFHKTAELLLVKERRSTVNEADALVQLTNILSGQISLLANSFCNALNQLVKTAEKPDKINANITTIFLEAANANSYIQDAFRLLIPILQVGAI